MNTPIKKLLLGVYCNTCLSKSLVHIYITIAIIFVDHIKEISLAFGNKINIYIPFYTMTKSQKKKNYPHKIELIGSLTIFNFIFNFKNFI